MSPERRFGEAKARTKNIIARKPKEPFNWADLAHAIKDEAEAYRGMVRPEYSFSDRHEISLIKFSWEE